MSITISRSLLRRSPWLGRNVLASICVLGVACVDATVPEVKPPQFAYLTPDGSAVSIPILHIIDPATGSVVEQVSLPHNATAVTASPDGSQIAFALAGLSVMNRDGSGLHSIYAPGSKQIITPDWSPNGQEIAFTEMDGGTAALRRLSASGGAPTTIPTQLQGNHGKWSPNGTELVLGAVRADSAHYLLALVSRDGTAARFLTPASSAQLDDYDEPSWSPDGTQIAFTEWHGSGPPTITIVSRDGSGMRQITNGVENAINPVWSADGTEIFFVGWRDNAAPGRIDEDVFAVNVSSGQVRQVTHTPAVQKYELMRIAR